jgi:FkbM family methyltransferase
MYSQYAQDLYVIEQLAGQREGFFLDSGASNGVRVNNTFALEIGYGWRGICVEPNTAFFAELVRNRGATCVNCCLYDRAGPVQFLETADVLGGILEAYDPRVLAEAKRRYEIPIDDRGDPKTVTKLARTPASLLDELRAPRTIDYWSLDTEGSELAILHSFPFTRYELRVVTVEHNWKPARESIRLVPCAASCCICRSRSSTETTGCASPAELARPRRSSCPQRTRNNTDQVPSREACACMPLIVFLHAPC